MSNDEYLQWQGLLYKVAKRYVGINSLYEIDDLIQIGAIGLAKGLKTYENKSDIPLTNWLANNISWTIYREINKKKSIDNTISLNIPIGEDNDTTLEETVVDDNVDVEAFIEDKLMIRAYEDEIIKYLDKRKADIMILKYFHNMSNSYIEKVMNMSSISSTITAARLELVHRSKLFRQEYKRIHGISDYNTERMALI